MFSDMFKLIQRQTYNFFAQKYSTAVLFIGLVVIIVSAFSFGAALVDWSQEKYSRVYNFYSDNLKEKSLQSKLCQYLPIDVVYTWVNGSDPLFLESLNFMRTEIEKESPKKNASEIHKRCPSNPCLDSHMVVVYPNLPASVKPSDLAKTEPVFRSVFKIVMKQSHDNRRQNVSVVSLDTIKDAESCVRMGFFVYDGINYTVGPGYLTFDWMAKNTVLLDDTLIISGIPLKVMEDQLIDRIPKRLHPLITKVTLFRDTGIAIISVTHTMALESLLLLDGNFTFGYRDPSFSAANLVLDLPNNRFNEEIGRSRFEDNEELRYSLRSLEKHAPWVRNIYIVTNGQIPYWLNLDNPRISVVTHDEIFANLSHLPTFSSPAIEVHLHRIHGLSQKFLYLNDDVMFGRDVWPDDFYTHARGQKVYLAWSVPDCRDGCPNSWINDGYCDRGCNNSDCQYDGGDCLVDHLVPAAPGSVLSGEFDVFQHDLEKLYCQPNCATMWIADKYCDTSCNVKECVFDGGDCGVDDFHQMHAIELNENQTSYIIPQGVCQMYFNLSRFLGPTKSVHSGWYDVELKSMSAVRAMAVNQRSQVLALLLSENRYLVTSITLYGHKANHTFAFNFTVTANTSMLHDWDLPAPIPVAVPTVPGAEKPPLFQSQPVGNSISDGALLYTPVTFRPDEEYPKVRSKLNDDDLVLSVYANVNETAMDLPSDLHLNLSQIESKLLAGELTEKGARKAKAKLMKSYFDTLAKDKLPELKLIQLLAASSSLPPATQNNSTFIIVESRSSTLDHVVELINEQRQVNIPLANGKEVLSDSTRDKLSYLTENRSILDHSERLTKTSYTPDRWSEIQKKRGKNSAFTTGRHLLDTFGDSLRHANRLLNEQFGFETRKVPAHMAHMIDTEVMTQLQNRFPNAFDTTSSHQIRNSEDVQLAFAYFYFLMSEPQPFDPNSIFDEYDTDASGTLADRELRTLLARLHNLPVTFEKMKQLERIVTNCSENLPPEFSSGLTAAPFEHYLDSNTPIVTRQLVLNCKPLLTLLQTQLKETKRYPFEVVGEEEVAFKMIQINISRVVKQLDEIRAQPRKFICLNDNIDHTSEQAATVKAILVDFYESLFPKASQFELPAFYRNRFLHVDQLREWRRYRDLLRVVTYSALTVLVFVALASYYHHQIGSAWKKIFPRRSRPRTTAI